MNIDNIHLYELLVLLNEREIQNDSMLKKDIVKYFKETYNSKKIVECLNSLMDMGSVRGCFTKDENGYGYHVKIFIDLTSFAFLESMKRSGEYQKVLDKYDPNKWWNMV